MLCHYQRTRWYHHGSKCHVLTIKTANKGGKERFGTLCAEPLFSSCLIDSLFRVNPVWRNPQIYISLFLFNIKRSSALWKDCSAFLLLCISCFFRHIRNLFQRFAELVGKQDYRKGNGNEIRYRLRHIDCRRLIRREDQRHHIDQRN